MSTDPVTRPRSRASAAAMAEQKTRRRRTRILLLLGAALAAGLLTAGAVALWPEDSAEPEAAASSGSQPAEAVHGSEDYPYAIGDPGPGEQAPDFTLPATTGEDISLSDYRGQSVLLYFQEGVMCQACFDQITDLEDNAEAVEDAGVDHVLSITTDPVDVSAQKSADMELSTPTLADTDLEVSEQYDTNSYGMMGGSHNGHTFMLISPEGEIRWRADYGGEPNYTMFLPTDQILADMQAALQGEETG